MIYSLANLCHDEFLKQIFLSSPHAQDIEGVTKLVRVIQKVRARASEVAHLVDALEVGGVSVGQAAHLAGDDITNNAFP